MSCSRTDCDARCIEFLLLSIIIKKFHNMRIRCIHHILISVIHHILIRCIHHILISVIHHMRISCIYQMQIMYAVLLFIHLHLLDVPKIRTKKYGATILEHQYCGMLFLTIFISVLSLFSFTFNPRYILALCNVV